MSLAWFLYGVVIGLFLAKAVRALERRANLSNEAAHFELYQDKQREWRWRLVSTKNGKTIADSAESYHNRADCEHGINFVKEYCLSAVTRVL